MYSTLDSDHSRTLDALYGPLPLGVLVCGPDLRPVWANRAFGLLTEVTPGDLDLMSLPDVLSLFCLGPDMGPDGLMESPGQWRESSKPIAKATGVMAWVRARLEPLDLEGVCGCHLALLEDVTPFKVAIEGLLDRSNLYQSIVETRPDLICCFMPNWSLTYANASFARHFGLDRDNLVGEFFLSLINPDRRETFSRAADGITPESPYAELEQELPAPEPGAPSAWMRWTIQGFFYKTGHIRDYQASGVDITAQKLTESGFIHADRLVSLGTLVSEVAHEISNPNNCIMLNAPLVLDLWRAVLPGLEELERRRQAGLPGPDPLSGLHLADLTRDVPMLLEGIVEGSRRIRDFVWQLKNFARKDAEGGFEPVQVGEVVQSAALIMSKSIGQATSRFSVRHGKGLPPVRGRRQRLEQVVVNLVQNACHALTGPHQAIEIETAHDEDTGRVRISVRDEGLGIAPENLSRITEPFFSTKRGQGGTGLGLSISLSIAREHGGALEFSSSPGRGTLAALVLPAIRTERPEP